MQFEIGPTLAKALVSVLGTTLVAGGTTVIVTARQTAVNTVEIQNVKQQRDELSSAMSKLADEMTQTRQELAELNGYLKGQRNGQRQGDR